MQCQRFGGCGWNFPVGHHFHIWDQAQAQAQAFLFSCYFLLNPLVRLVLALHPSACFHASGPAHPIPVNHPVKQIKLRWWGCSWV